MSTLARAAEQGDCTTMAKRANPDRRRSGNGGYPPIESAGYLVRDAHRAFQKLLEKRIAAHGISRGQWYFLRVLWIEDGLSQRELSARVGMMEPTTVIALRSMEKTGLIRRVRTSEDKRVANVCLTAKAKRIREQMLLLARGINEDACQGLSREELDTFRRAITHMTENLDRVMR
jgi:MarR family transcriptional regulator, organic hydroperoxide resistance regulator